MTEIEGEKVHIDGHQIALPDDRFVWAGKAPDGSWYFQFGNGDVLTKLRLSQEALDALCRLTQDAGDWKELKVLRFVYKMHEMEWSQSEAVPTTEPTP